MAPSNRNTLSNAGDYEFDYMSDDDSNPSFNRSSDDRFHDQVSDSNKASQKVWWKSTKMWYVLAACSAFIAVGVLIAEVVSDNEETSINATNKAPSTINETTTTSPTANQFSGSNGGATTMPSVFLSPSPTVSPFTFSSKKPTIMSTKRPTIASTKMPRSTKAPFPTKSTKSPYNGSTKMPSGVNYDSTKMPASGTSTKIPSNSSTTAPNGFSTKSPT